MHFTHHDGTLRRLLFSYTMRVNFRPVIFYVDASIPYYCVVMSVIDSIYTVRFVSMNPQAVRIDRLFMIILVTFDW